MANDSFSQQALALDKTFQLRLQNNLMTVAWQVLNESAAVPGHVQRATYARQVISNPATYVLALAPSFVTRGNVMAFATSYDFANQSVVTASGDPDMQSQLSTDWYAMSGASSS